MQAKYEICTGLFHGFEWSTWVNGSPQQRLGLLPAAQEHILSQDTGKDRLTSGVRDLTKAFALAVPHAEALRIRDDVAFFQAVAAVMAKRAPGDPRPGEEIAHAHKRHQRPRIAYSREQRSACEATDRLGVHHR
jgi:type I restriction enzyme R subunit